MYTLRDTTKGSGGTGASAHSQKGLVKPVPDCCDCWPSPPSPPGWQLLLHMCTKVCKHNSTQVWLSFLWLHHLIIRITACLRPLALQPDRGSTMQTNIPVMLIYLRDLYLVKMVTWLSGGNKILFVMLNSPYWPGPWKHAVVGQEWSIKVIYNNQPRHALPITHFFANLDYLCNAQPVILKCYCNFFDNSLQ